MLRQLLGKECVAYIPSQAPASTSLTPTLTVSMAKFKRLHAKNSKGQEHLKHMVLFYWHFPGSDGDAVYKHTAMRQNLLCRSESTVMQSFESDTGGRNGLSLLQREKRRERRGGMGRQKRRG